MAFYFEPHVSQGAFRTTSSERPKLACLQPAATDK